MQLLFPKKNRERLHKREGEGKERERRERGKKKKEKKERGKEKADGRRKTKIGGSLPALQLSYPCAWQQLVLRS